MHHCPFATEAMSRERFQLISRHICFDDIDTRKNRENNKFHKMEAIFKLYKKNLNLIVPSYQLCIDETLYAFRGYHPAQIYIINDKNYSEKNISSMLLLFLEIYIINNIIIHRNLY